MSVTKVHVAVVELSEDMDPLLFASRELDDLHHQIRAAIEALVLEDVVPQHWPEVYDYVSAHRGAKLSWHEWHEELHEIDGTPWVTITTKEI